MGSRQIPALRVWLQEASMHAMRLLGVLHFLLMAGCAGVERTPTGAGAQAPEAAAIGTPGAPPKNTMVARTGPPDARTPAKVPASPPSAGPPRKDPASPPLDLAALESRLRATKAIGMFTKIALKNQVDDLLDQFREHYQGRVRTSLAEMRQSFDRLLLKLLSLLQDDDPELARAIAASREPIWNILADPATFAAL
jgi:hypothetical protein